MTFKRWNNLAGWLVFAVAFTVYYLSAERTGSLWDCGEFILGAYKLQVVHPPGAPIFLLIGRLFTLVAEMVSDNPEDIAFSVNLMSGICSAFVATFVCWITMILGKISLVGRTDEPNKAQEIALFFAGLSAGLATAFATSIWFSAVEGEVYAMSTCFTAMVFWAGVKWYYLPDKLESDRWLIFAFFAAALSVGVHLLSLLTFPAIALLYYYKKVANPNKRGSWIAVAGGFIFIGIMLGFIIPGIPSLWSKFELIMVNGMGLPFHTGLIPLVILIAAILYFGLRHAHRTGNAQLQQIILALGLIVVGYSTIGMVVVRAKANTPINMNAPDDAMRLVPYLNREQYGERPLVRGPHFDAKLTGTKTEDRYGRVGDHYEVVDQKVSYEYRDSDKMLFPRMTDTGGSRPELYRQWLGDKKGVPTFADNISFFLNYQISWMYVRYFMWNFVGRQNGEQGIFSWDKRSGHWLSGIPFIDNARLVNQSELPAVAKENQARNTYFFLPLIFGLLGLFFQFRRSPKEFNAVLVLFLVTGLGIILYSNQPPREPRERDYVLAGSMFTFAIWIGLGVLALFRLFIDKVRVGHMPAAVISGLLVLIAPIIMGFQNFDDHSRRHHKASRDYAANFLNSCEPNAIIFTYGDNDTYPLWYAQEVEGIRRDVRVANLSLIAVDWYISNLRRKINDSAPIKMTIPEEALRGMKRVQLPIPEQADTREMEAGEALQFIAEDHPFPIGGGRNLDSYVPARNLFINLDIEKMRANGALGASDTGQILTRLPIKLQGNSIIKDELAVLDIIASNIHDRPIYFAVTCQPDKLLGLEPFMSLEGLALRITPVPSQSDQGFGIIGAGRVDSDKLLDNVKNKWRWGNLDKMRLFVDESYMPSIQSQKYVILRAARDFSRRGEKAKAVEIMDLYFNAFPHMNFPYDYSIVPLIMAYVQADAYDKAKPHLEILADQTFDWLKFYYSLSVKELESGYSQDFAMTDRTREDLITIAKEAKDTAFADELTKRFAPYAKNPAQ
jgi:hypothetical protein